MVEGRRCVTAQSRPASILEWVVQHSSVWIFACQYKLAHRFQDILVIEIWATDFNGHTRIRPSTMPKKRWIIILAGPNGAGKTTFAREYLQKEAYCPDFVNVDLIAAGLSPFNPQRAAIQAGKIMLSEIKRRVRKGESFAFETTLSGHIYARWIPEWRRGGYRVRLMFLSLPDAETAIERVAARVAQGWTLCNRRCRSSPL